MNDKAILITSDKCWMEHTAITQLDNVAALPGVVRAVGLPDLHAGRSPVGIAVETKGLLPASYRQRYWLRNGPVPNGLRPTQI